MTTGRWWSVDVDGYFIAHADLYPMEDR